MHSRFTLHAGIIQAMAASGSSLAGPHPLVSVAVTAYNSASSIARAIHSVSLQQVSFPVEIIVGDDFSPDGTAAVVRELQRCSPVPITLLDRSRNLGMQRNYFDTFEHCRGKYIAWLDADDCWTHPHKLAMQVSALESDPTLAICAHFVRHVSFDGDVHIERYPSRPSGRYTLNDIILQNFVPSPSIVFRGGLHRQLPGWFFSLTGVVDWPILLLAARTGDILLLDHTMADYGVSANSAYNSKDFLYRERIDREVRERMCDLLPSAFHRQVRAGLGRHYESLSYDFATDGRFQESRHAALRALRAPDLTSNCVSKTRTIVAALFREARSILRAGASRA